MKKWLTLSKLGIENLRSGAIPFNLDHVAEGGPRTSTPRLIFETGQSSWAEAFAPLADDLMRRSKTRGE